MIRPFRKEVLCSAIGIDAKWNYEKYIEIIVNRIVDQTSRTQFHTIFGHNGLFFQTFYFKII